MPGSDYFSARAAIIEAIPVIAISGRMFEERVALSLLSHLGEASTVAESGRDYVDIAVQLALDPEKRAAKADHMRNLMLASPMADMSQYVARLEDALFRAVAAATAPD